MLAIINNASLVNNTSFAVEDNLQIISSPITVERAQTLIDQTNKNIEKMDKIKTISKIEHADKIIEKITENTNQIKKMQKEVIDRIPLVDGTNISTIRLLNDARKGTFYTPNEQEKNLTLPERVLYFEKEVQYYTDMSNKLNIQKEELKELQEKLRETNKRFLSMKKSLVPKYNIDIPQDDSPIINSLLHELESIKTIQRIQHEEGLEKGSYRISVFSTDPDIEKKIHEKRSNLYNRLKIEKDFEAQVKDNPNTIGSTMWMLPYENENEEVEVFIDNKQ
jgi:hypothetical protein